MSPMEISGQPSYVGSWNSRSFAPPSLLSRGDSWQRTQRVLGSNRCVRVVVGKEKSTASDATLRAILRSTLAKVGFGFTSEEVRLDRGSTVLGR